MHLQYKHLSDIYNNRIIYSKYYGRCQKRDFCDFSSLIGSGKYGMKLKLPVKDASYSHVSVFPY
jgi:hypothetical protein